MGYCPRRPTWREASTLRWMATILLNMVSERDLGLGLNVGKRSSQQASLRNVLDKLQATP